MFPTKEPAGNTMMGEHLGEKVLRQAPEEKQITSQKYNGLFLG